MYITKVIIIFILVQWESLYIYGTLTSEKCLQFLPSEILSLDYHTIFKNNDLKHSVENIFWETVKNK